MKDDPRMTRRQFTAMVFVALLSPLLRVLPRAAVLEAGRAAWLCAIPAGLALWGFAAFMTSFLKKLRFGEGMAALLLRCLGPVAGRAALLLYGCWFLFYAGFLLRSGGERLVSTAYPLSSPGSFGTVMLLLCALAALGTLRGTARTAVLLRAILLAALGVVFVLAAQDVKAEFLWPVTAYDALPAVKGCWPIVNVGGAAALFSFAEGYVEPAGKRMKCMAGWLAALLAVSAGLCASVTGVFGPALTTRFNYPFFVMIRGLEVMTLAERIEAAVLAIWIFADFVVCTLLLRCAHEALRTVFSLPPPECEKLFCLKSGRWLLLTEAAVIWAVQAFLAPDGAALDRLSDLLVPILSAGFVFAGLPLAWVVGKLRKII